MKKLLVLLLAIGMILSCFGCSTTEVEPEDETLAETQIETEVETETEIEIETQVETEPEAETTVDPEIETEVETRIEIGISRQVPPGVLDQGVLTKIPRFNTADSTNGWQVDLRSADLSEMDVMDRYSDLIYARFDTNTIWPENLPDGFEPDRFIELGLDPGLGVRELHKQGITGKGVSIAIIDSALLTGHSEYKDNLKFYEEIAYDDSATADMHGCAVASIAVGTKGGVAPEANLYFIGVNGGTSIMDEYPDTQYYFAQAIERLVEVNKQLPEEEKIKVISMSAGFNGLYGGYKEVTAAIRKAEESGIFVVTTGLYSPHDRLEDEGLNFWGTHIEALDDRNDINNYSVGSWMKTMIRLEDNPGYGHTAYDSGNKIFMPMDSRAYASCTGDDAYEYAGPICGMSWLMPYVAGLYVLCEQVHPGMTPEIYWEYLLETADLVTVDNLGNEIEIPLVNPQRLIEALAEIQAQGN